MDEKNSSVTVNIDRNNLSCTAEASGSVATVSSALSSHCSNSVTASQSPRIERQNTVVPKSFEISRSEPNSPSKPSVPIMSNFMSTVRCSSPLGK